LKQGSETLAGRILYQELTPFLISELGLDSKDNLYKNYWLRGGFPRSYLASNDKMSYRWRKGFIKTFLERDISNLGFFYPPATMERLWRMLSYMQGQVINLSQLGSSLGVSHTMVRNYLDVLQQTYMIRILQPWAGNLRKRLIKTPKVYIRDTGILHALQNIQDFDTLFGNPVSGASWETMVIENILAEIEGFEISFYRTSNGNEIDLILEKSGERYAVEIKLSSSPKLSSGFYKTLDELKIIKAWIASPVIETYFLKENVKVASVSHIIEELTNETN
jgi:predicted AAA+ superfamily ATPase